MTFRPRTQNAAENQVIDEALAQGYQVYKRGWPDFILVKGDEIRFVEVKPEGSRSKGSPVQRRVAWLLKKLGIKVELAEGSLQKARPMVD